MPRFIEKTEATEATYKDYVPMEATNIFHHEQILVEGDNGGKPGLFEGGTVQPGTGFVCHVNLAKELKTAGLAKGAHGFDPDAAENAELTPHFQVSASDLPGGANRLAVTGNVPAGFSPNTAPEGFKSNGTEAPKTLEPQKAGTSPKTDNK